MRKINEIKIYENCYHVHYMENAALLHGDVRVPPYIARAGDIITIVFKERNYYTRQYIVTGKSESSIMLSPEPCTQSPLNYGEGEMVFVHVCARGDYWRFKEPFPPIYPQLKWQPAIFDNIKEFTTLKTCKEGAILPAEYNKCERLDVINGTTLLGDVPVLGYYNGSKVLLTEELFNKMLPHHYGDHCAIRLL